MPRSAHIVIATVGSLGDLFPLLAVGQALQRRGHRITVATHAVHQPVIAQSGLGFADASGMAEPDDRAAFIARAFHPWRGPSFVVRDFAAADVQASYRKLLPVCAGADLLITTTLAFAGQILGEQGEADGTLRWMSVVLAPAGFLALGDMPATGLDLLDAWVRASPAMARALGGLARRVTHGWTAPVRAFRRTLGLPARSPRGDPFHRGQHAPRGVLALFPPAFGAAQPDWPPQTHLCGFARYVQPSTLDPALSAFLDAGTAPLVFSLGSTAVHANAAFLRESLQATAALGQRAVLLTGSPEMRARLPARLPDTVHCIDYAPHAALFPCAAVVVHHGGIGTSAEALRAGVPALVVPHGFDQPDNAARLQRLGVARVLPASRYRADRAARVLRALQHPSFMTRSRTLASGLALEGATVAADAVEAALP